MDLSTLKNKKLGKGRPRTDATPLTLRVFPNQLLAIDAWIDAQSDPKPSRPEAIRRLLANALLAGYAKNCADPDQE